MLSRTHRTIFVHIPKTGGQSIETVFINAHGLTWETRAPLLLRRNPDRTRGPQRLAHLYADEYCGLGFATSDDFSTFFKFAAVRNPWARAVSSYKYAFQRSGMPFSRYAREVLLSGKHIADPRHFDPQLRYLRGVNGTTLVDKVIRYETLAAEFAEVSRKIFGREEPLPVVNVSPDRRDYRTFYDDATAEIVAKVYADDIAAFGYSFDQGA
jgi:hypothetical protein